MYRFNFINDAYFMHYRIVSTIHQSLRLLVLALFATLLFSSCKKDTYAKTPENEPAEELAAISKEDLIKRGAYLVNSIGCADCHSPKRMGERGPEFIPELHLSGYQQGNELPPISEDALAKGWMLFNADLTAGVGPWGVSFAANLTSDETGIGNWSFEQFKTAIRKGKYKGLENARDLLPPMPWQNFAQLSDEDLEAMFEYLKSTKPVKNIVPAPIPPSAPKVAGL